MGYIDKLIEARASMANPSKYLTDFFQGGTETYTGTKVNEQTALNQAAVYACVRVISDSTASTPIHLYKRRDDKGKDRATDDSLYYILKDQFNTEMAAFTAKETAAAHIEQWGNAFFEIEKNQQDQIIGLWPLRPDRMEVRREGGQKFYHYSLDNKVFRFRADQIWHIPGFGFDGLIGYSPIQMAKQTIGLALGTEEYGSRFFGNNAHAGLVLRHPGRLGEEAQKNLRKSITEAHGGLSSAHRLMILEEDMQVETVSIPPDSAQFLETRKFQIAEIARFFRMQLHKLQEMEHATFSNIEHQAIEHIQDTLQPRFIRWEAAIQKDLIPEHQKRTHYAEFLLDNLLRGDATARHEAYASGKQWGYYSTNDIMEMENRNPVEGGDEYYIPLNMVPASLAGQLPESTETDVVVDDEDDEDERSIKPSDNRATVSRRRVAQSFRSVFHSTAERMVRAEIREVSKAVEKESRSEESLIKWMEAYYAGHSAYLISQIKPLIRSYGEAMTAEVALEMGSDLMLNDDFVNSYTDRYSERHIDSSWGQLKNIMETSDNPFEDVRDRLEEWGEKRADKITDQEMTRAESAFAKDSYRASGVTKLRWKTHGENCPFCNGLEGKVVGIDDNFVERGAVLDPEGRAPMKVWQSIGHPPIHSGCDCTIEPEL